MPIGLVEISAHALENRIASALDGSKRVVLWDFFFVIERHKHRLLPINMSTHQKASLNGQYKIP